MSSESTIKKTIEDIKNTKLYTSKEVLELLIRCKNRFGGSELYDQVSDSEVKEWFNEDKNDE